jgi:hypothetical protein
VSLVDGRLKAIVRRQRGSGRLGPRRFEWSNEHESERGAGSSR